MRTKEIVIADDANRLHMVLKCLSCSITGVELGSALPEGTGGGYTEAQLALLDRIAETHNRSVHQGIGQLRVYNYVQESPDENDMG